MNKQSSQSINRRHFLTSGLGAACGVSMMAPGAHASALRLLGGLQRDDRTLVVIQLTGGNDGLSTVVPYGDDEYHRARKSTRIATADLHKVDDYRGFHPDLGKLAKHYRNGKVAVIQGVGYPGPNRSHFKSREIWHTADLRGRAAGDGWLGKMCQHTWPDASLPELSVHIGSGLPFSVHSSTHAPVVFNTPDSYRWLGDEESESSLEPVAQEGGKEGKKKNSVLDRLRGVMSDARDSSARILQTIRGYETDVPYGNHQTSQSLKTAAALIHSGLGSRIISVSTGGFDTHAYQKGQHADSLRAFDDALDSFLTDVRRCEAGKKTMVLAFSEFGRRVKENGSGGTDHGKASVMFAAGDPVLGGLYGDYPSLTALDDKDLRYNVDFRNVYSAAASWMGADPAKVLGKRYDPLGYVG